MSRVDETPTPGVPTPTDAPATPAPVSRRKFLATVAVAAAAAPTLGTLIEGAGEADAAARPKHAPAAKPAPTPPAKAAEPAAAPNGARPDYSVAKTPAEREALEKQWKAMADLVTALRKTPVPVGAEFATGALAPARLRREGN